MAKKKTTNKNSVHNNKFKQSSALPKKKSGLSLFLPLAGILLLTFIVYFRSLKNGFTNYDDDVLILNNDLVRNLTSGNLYNIFFSFINGMYHPLVTLSWSIEYSLFGSGATHFHLINLFFHLLNVWLVYRFILLLTKKLNIAVIVALVFAVQPMISESVYWLSERKDLLCTAFMLGGLIHYLKYLKNELHLKYIVIAFVFLVFALFSKPSAIVFPLLLLVIDYYYGRKIDKRNLLEKIPFFAFAVSFGVIAVIAAGSVEGINNLKEYSLIDRIFFVSKAVMFYIYKLIAPFALSAKHFYPLKHGNFLPTKYYVSFVAFILIVICILKFGRKNREMISGCLFYLVCISIVLPVVPVGDTIVAERYSYMSYIGLLLIAGHFIDKYKDSKFLFLRTGTLSYVLIATLTIFFSVITFSRNDVWKNSENLWTDVIEKDPYAVLAYVARGDAKAGAANYEEASKDYTMAVIIDSTAAVAYNNRGYVFIKRQQYDKAETDFDHAIRLQPRFSKAYYNRSCLFIETKEYEKAIADCNEAILLSPGFAYAYYNRGNALYLLQRYSKAIPDFDKAIELNGNVEYFYYYRGLTNFELNKYDTAIIDFNSALDLNANYIDALLGRSKCYNKKGNYSAAISDLDAILHLKPDNSTYLYYRGNNKLLNNNNEGALEDFNDILNTSPSFAPAFFGIAKVYIATGLLDSVCVNLTKASDLGLEVDEEYFSEYCK